MKQILIRDCLQDSGKIPMSGFYSDSPDIIVHKQVQNPLDFFTKNYDEDVAEPFTRGSNNLLYVRAKNSGSVAATGYIRTYAAKATLFMNPAVWVNNINKTLSGKTIVETQLMAPREIGVTKDPFLFNAKESDNYCHIAYASMDGRSPDIPEEMENYGHFVTWVMYNPNVALRNFNVLSSKNMPSLRQTCEFANPSRDIEHEGGFLLTLNGDYPVGTEIMMECGDIGLKDCFRVEDQQMEHVFWTEKQIPPLYSGTLNTIIHLPMGGQWPLGGSFSVSFYAAEAKNEIAMRFSVSASSFKKFKQETHQLLGENARLIKIGTCSTKIIE